MAVDSSLALVTDKHNYTKSVADTHFCIKVCQVSLNPNSLKKKTTTGDGQEKHPPSPRPSTHQLTLSVRQTSEQETSQVLLASAQVFFLVDVKFSPLMFDLAQNE